jgi:hypothetical protein
MTINYENLKKILTPERLEVYRPNAQDLTQTIAEYENNIRLAEALYSSLHVFEIVLRNRLEQVLQLLFGTQWFTEPRFFIVTSEKIRNKLTEALLSLQEKNNERLITNKPIKPLTSGRVVAELSLSFWMTLLDPYHEQIFWRVHQRMIFPNVRSAERDIKIIRAEIREIRFLRNRVMHHEPILYDQHLLEKHQNLTKLLTWLSVEAGAWLLPFDRFAGVHNSLLGSAT